MSSTQSPPAEQWERTSFSLAEQIKIVLLLVDSLPFRATNDDRPHRLDLKEAARLTGWDVPHVELISRLVFEQSLIQAGDERFFWTEQVQKWDSQSPDDLEKTPLPLRVTSGNWEQIIPASLAVTNLLWEILDVAENYTEEIDRRKLNDQFSDTDPVETIMEQLQDQLDETEVVPETVIDSILEQLHWLGWLDMDSDGDPNRYRLNDRGEHVIKHQEPKPLESEDDLPLIAQPDGSLLVPLESGFEDFARLHPFTMMVDVDRMMQYRMDHSSLTHALNKGWEVNEFFQFLKQRTGELPEPVQMMLEDLTEEPESLDILEVSHLLEFGNGSTASEAVRLLSNYNPERIGETIIALQSSTSEDTIRKNLSRGGIRIQSDESDGKLRSPFVEVENEDE